MPPKKAKGKQKQAEKTTSDNAEPIPPPQIVSASVMTSKPVEEHVTEPENTWGTAGAWGGGGGGGGGGGVWGTNAENAGDTWGMSGVDLPQQGSDDSSLGQSEILQPPPSHTPGVLETIPEQTPYNPNRAPLPDISEVNDELEYTESWSNQQDSATPQHHWGENPQSRTLSATIAASAMGSPAHQPTVSLTDAAVAAQKDLQKQMKTTTASQMARRMEESRRHSIDPTHLIPVPEKKPMSSASAAAAALEASHLKTRNVKQSTESQSQPAPGKMSWIHPKPFMEGARDPAHIPPDPTWIHTGGNTWSRKNLASKSGSAVNWAQPLTPWPPQRHPQAQQHSQPQRPSHKKHRSHAAYSSHRDHRHSASQPQHHQSWHSWGKERFEPPETETEESDESDGVNIVGYGGDSWGTYQQHPATHQRSGRDKRGRRRKDESDNLEKGGNWSGQGGWADQGKSSSAWGEQGNEGHVDKGWAGGGDGGDQLGEWGQERGASGWGQDTNHSRRKHDKVTSGPGQPKDTPGRGQDKMPQSGWGEDHGTSGWDQDKGASAWGEDKPPGGTGWSQDKGTRGTGWSQDKGPGGTGWSQDKGPGGSQDKGWSDADWNQDKGSGWAEPAWGQKQSTTGRGGQPGDTLGTAGNEGGAGWGQAQSTEWGKEAPSFSEVPGGTRNAVSTRQISQIYNSLLNVPHNQPAKAQGQQHLQASNKANAQATAPANQDNWGVWEAQESGWGSDHGEDTPRRVRFSPKASELWGGSPRSVPSKTMAAAQQQYGLTTTLINDASGVRFVESQGAGLAFVSNAFFGNARLSRERIYWLFSSDKDQRISALLAWVQKMSFNLGTYGLMKFLENRERGGLFVNAAFRMRQHPHEPAFDFLTFNQLQGTMDKTLQESVAFYDPAQFVMIFVFLPSQSGSSVAIWRKRINVPDSARQRYRAEIDAITRTLRAPKDYVVMVDELPRKPKPTPAPHRPGQLRKLSKAANLKATTSNMHQTAVKKERKWWKFFLS